MGIDGQKPDLVQPVRDGCEVVVQIPAGARKVRVFLQSSYVTVDAGYDRDGSRCQSASAATTGSRASSSWTSAVSCLGSPAANAA